MKDSRYRTLVDLLLKVLPFVAKEKVFALKGGTAINLFVWDMPRLSVDIDLTFLPVLGREESFQQISAAIGRIKIQIETALKGARVIPIPSKGSLAATSFTVDYQGAQIKSEVNFVLRGTVFPITVMELCDIAQKEFNVYAQIQTLSKADLYGGKLCAALDRQHPRDFYDVMKLLQDEGITEQTRRAFVVYLASHSRPMNELLNPNWKEIEAVFIKEFVGMTIEPVELSSLLKARDEMHSILLTGLTANEKRFLISMKEGNPEWEALSIPGIENLPGLKWKLSNIKKMSKQKHAKELSKIKAVLGL